MTTAKRPLFFAALLLAALVVLPLSRAQGGDETPRRLESGERQALFDRLAQVQQGITTFQADFEEKRTLSGLRRPLRYAGRLYYRRNDLFFMAYTTPIRYILRVQDNTALMYVQGNPSADRASISSSRDVAPQADWFAWDPAAFTGEVYRQPDGYRLVSRQQNGPGLTILLDPESLLARQITIDNGSGDTTDIVLSAVETGRPLPESVTGYRLPAGVTINEMDAP